VPNVLSESIRTKTAKGLAATAHPESTTPQTAPVQLHAKLARQANIQTEFSTLSQIASRALVQLLLVPFFLAQKANLAQRWKQVWTLAKSVCAKIAQQGSLPGKDSTRV
jgi:DNA-binding MurR/RpiR family transcriptional regulator